MRKSAVTVLLLLAFFLGILGGALDVRFYGTPFVTLNGGITYGDCGVEIWGVPGHYCGQDY